MALLIEDEETDRLARELSAATGETVDQAVNAALRERLRQVSAVLDEVEYISRIKAITQHLANMPVLDDRPSDELIGYNEHGLFD